MATAAVAAEEMKAAEEMAAAEKMAAEPPAAMVEMVAMVAAMVGPQAARTNCFGYVP